MRLQLIYTGIAILLLTSCYKDVDNTQTETETDLPKTIVNTKLSGKVVDSDGELLEDYTLDWTTGSHDVDGKYFIADLQTVNKFDQTIWVRKEGSELGLAHIPFVENDINELEITVFSNWESETVNSASVIDIEGVAITIDPSDFGATSLDVAFRSLNNIDGQLTHGYSLSGQLMRLSQVSVYNVDVTGGNNDGLISVNIPAGTMLFSYDTDKGIWMEVNSANEVRPGYFAVAESVPAVIGSGAIMREGQSVAYQKYEIENTLRRSTAKGNWIAILPQSSQVEVILLNPCEELVSAQIVSTQKEEVIEDLEVGPDAIYQVLETQIIECDGSLSENNIIQVSEASGEEVLYYFSDPNISTVIPLCGEQFQIAAYDPSEDQAGLQLPWNTEIEDEITYLSTCPAFENGYSLYRIEGFTRVYETFTIVQESGRTELFSNDGNMKLVFNGDSKGNYDVDMVNVKIYDEDFGDKGYSVDCANSGCGIDDFYVSHINESDNWVRVTFSGTVWMQTLNPLTAGNFEVEGIILCKAE